MPKLAARRRPPATQTKRRSRSKRAASNRYWDVTHRPLQCLVFLLPLVLAYEVGMAMLHGQSPSPQQPALAAQKLLQWFFSLFGVTGYYLPGAALIAFLLGWHIVSRNTWKIEWPSLAGMAGESILLSIPLLFLNRWIPVLAARPSVSPQAVFATAMGSTMRGDRWDDLLLSVGAGLYEELVFRLLIISLLMFLLIDMCRLRQAVGVALSVILSSLLFAAHHYYPIGADPWSSGEFAFRAAAGAYLAAVFVLRGFGLAVGCHVTYDVIAFLL